MSKSIDELMSGLMDNLYDIKDKINDSEYINLVETCGKIKRKMPRLVKVFYIETYIYNEGDEEEDPEVHSVYQEGYFRVIESPRQRFRGRHDSTISASLVEWDYSKKPAAQNGRPGDSSYIIYKIEECELEECD